MVPVVKGLLGAGAVAIACYGAYELSTRLGYSIPEAKTIYDLFLNDSSKYSGKFGSDFRRHFVGFKEGNGKENESWWNWSFKYRLTGDKDSKKDLSNEFNAITSGFGTEGISLSKVCDTAYDKVTKTDIFPDADADKSKEKYRRDIWTYCSVSGLVPSALLSSDLTTIDKKTTWSQHLQSKLVSTKTNDEFWKRQQEEFGSTSADTDTFFTKKIKELNSKSVKDACAAVYKLDKDGTIGGDDPKPTEEDILKYCSLTRK